MDSLYAEADVEAEAAALTLLLRSQLRDVENSGHAAGSLRRDGVQLRVKIIIFSADGKPIGNVRGVAESGRIGALADELATAITKRLRSSNPRPSQASLGQIYPYARAAVALQEGDARRAARELLAARPAVSTRIPAVKAVTKAVLEDESLPLAARVHAALVGRDLQKVRELADAQLAVKKSDSIALATKARVHLTLFDAKAARAELDRVGRKRDPFIRLTSALLYRDEPKRMGDELKPLLGSSPYFPAMVIISDLLPGALGSSAEKAVLKAARKSRDQAPELASALGLRAARGDIDLEKSLDLVAVRWLRDDELKALDPLIEKALTKGWAVGFRLRGEKHLRAGNRDEALTDFERALKKERRDPRLLRHRARILTSKGEHKAAVEAWKKVQKTASDRREFARALEAAGERDKARAMFLKLDDDSSVEAKTLAAEKLLAEGDAKAAVLYLEQAAKQAPDDVAVLQMLARAYKADNRAADEAATLELAKALEGKAEPDAAKTVDLAPDGDDPGGGDGARAADKAVGKAAKKDRGPRVPAELVDALTPFLEKFPDVMDNKIKSVVLIARSDSTEPFYWPYKVHPRQLRLGLSEALKPYDIRVLPYGTADSIGDCKAEGTKAAQLAAGWDADAALVYGVRTKGSDAMVQLCMIRADTNGRFHFYEKKLPGKKLGLVSWNRTPFYGIGAVLGLLVLWWLFRLLSAGSIKVKLTRDQNLEKDVYEIRITSSAKAPPMGEAAAFVKRLRATGHKKSRYKVTLAAMTTVFGRIPTGKWFVHLAAAHEKGGAVLALNGDFTKEVKVRTGKTSIIEFDLVPKAAEVVVVIRNEQGPIARAKVWLDDDEEQSRYTRADGQLSLLVPFGEHIIHIDCDGDVLSKPIIVSDGKKRNIDINMEREKRLTYGISLAEIPLPEEDTSQSRPQVELLGPDLDPDEPDAASDQGNAAAGAEYSDAGLQLPGMRRYEVIDELGQGAMGVVYRAHDRVLERHIALKVMRKELRQYPEACQLFIQEAKALAALNHPNIVTVFDKGQYDDQSYIVMELIEGATLERLLARDKRFEIVTALRYIDQACAGLSYAHKRRVIHRDIKPGNMFLTNEGTVKLGDFGLARVLQELQIKNTQVRGTPDYMAPEQIMGSDIDFRADLYAIGCSLYEFIAGRTPFVDGEVFYHHLHTEPEKLSSLVPGVPPVLDELLAACLAKKKEDRIQSADAIRAALRKVAVAVRGGG